MLLSSISTIVSTTFWKKHKLAHDVLFPFNDGEITSEELFASVQDADVLTMETTTATHE